MKTTTVRLHDDLLLLTREVGKINGLGVSEVVRLAVRDEIGRHAASNPEFAAIVQEVAQDSLNRHLQETAATLGRSSLDNLVLPSPSDLLSADTEPPIQ